MYYKKKEFSLYYEKYGKNKKNLLILPGWGDTRKTFKALIDQLKKDYTIYIFDYPGFGNTSFPDCDFTIYDYAFLFKNFIEEKKIENPYVIAHSFGGRIAILLSGYYQVPISKLVLLDAAGIRPKKKLCQLIKQTIYKFLKKIKFFLPTRKKEIYQKWLLKIFSSPDYQLLPPKMMKTFQNVVHENLEQYLSNMEVETLLIWGEEDLDTPISDGILMDEKIPSSALIRIPHGGHFCYLEYPLFILQLIHQFFNA